ncbi:histone deacetylase 6 isoform X1 [Diorhabda carinulata]|uniref:histone deacetylase 6 isoform X1 n=1 Tax=Diorhabda carinulata TaxID=1163345 RepID=UPI0025A0C074|nr:histone deacetylase 6 isoform X1 [Diorhabda carinulata]
MEEKDKKKFGSVAGNPSECSAKSSRQKLKNLIAERRRQRLDQTMIQPELMDPYEAVNRYKVAQFKPTGYIEEGNSVHYCIWDPNYPENPERVACSKRRLEDLDLIKRCKKVSPQKFPEDVYLKLHNKELYEKLKDIKNISEDKLQELASKYDSVFFTHATFTSSIIAAEAAITLTLEVARGNLKNGFALIRPPGHHAMADAFCGYCFLNNVALAAQVAIDKGLAKKVLIIDHDVHHGQGTQRMFYDRDDVLYFSIHRYEYGTFWPNLRESDSDYIGDGKGKGYNINIPLNVTGLGDADYLTIVFNILLPVAYEFNPDLIIISAGFDSCLGDEKGEMLVSPHFYGQLITLLSGLADGKLAVCLEGGYFLESLAEGVACTIKALLGDTCYPISSEFEVHPTLIDVINNTKYFLRDYWECFKNDPLFSFPKTLDLENCLEISRDTEHLTCISYKHDSQVPTIFETYGFYPQRTEEEHKTFLKMILDLRKEYSQGRKSVNVVGYAYDELLLRHKGNEKFGKFPERPERIVEILRSLDNFGILKRCQKIQLSEFNERKWIEKIHKKEYIIDVLEQRNLIEKADWFFNAETTDCILKCISCVISLAENIHQGSIRSGVAVVRPPGHHACFDEANGFCFVNNVVIAAQYLIEERKYKRVLIVDFDIHHGNGTQNLTYSRDDIMYISLHRFDKGKYFPFLDEADYNYVGSSTGLGYNINIPFNKGNKTDHDYWTVWLKLVLPLAYSYNPEFVIISAGFDAGYFDPLGNGYKLTPEIYSHFIQTLKPLASGKILLALEGGYHLESTALSLTLCMKALLGDPLPVPKFSDKVDQDTCETIQKVLSVHRDKWKILKVNKKIANFSCTEKEKTDLDSSCKKEIENGGSVENLKQKFKRNIIYNDV